MRTLRITGYSLEEVHFPEYSDPTWTVKIPARTFTALRIEIDEENEELRARHYWIDSKRLMAVLLPLLSGPGGTPRTYLIRKHGIPPKSAYDVSITSSVFQA